MILKLMFLIVSIIFSIFSVVIPKDWPNEQCTPQKNYFRVLIFPFIGSLLELMMCLIIGVLNPEGLTGTGIEVSIALLVLFPYALLCFFAGLRVKRLLTAYNEKFALDRRKYSPRETRNCIWYSVFAKLIFLVIEIMWLAEGG